MAVELPSAMAQGDVAVTYMAAEMSFDAKVVKGAPYSAEAITETVMTLADGNRIVRKNTAGVYRDGEGRTRREQTLSAVGPWATAVEPPTTVFINDPAAKVSYTLEPRSRTARKLDFGREGEVRRKLEEAVKVEQGQAELSAEDQQKIRHKMEMAAGAHARVGANADHLKVHSATAGRVAVRVRGQEAKEESLGKQLVEGVEAEGKRITHTIPAGEIGNERPIEIVSESWYSSELQVLVMTRHSDPRLGETTYRLTNINRAEPDRSLFEVPADYTVRETSITVPDRKLRRPAQEEQ